MSLLKVGTITSVGTLGILGALYTLSEVLNTGHGGAFLVFISLFVLAGAIALIAKAI